MGRYNEFFASVACPHCGAVGAVPFQATLGVLEWERFAIGEVVLGREPQSKGTPFGPDPAVDRQDLWAYGLGSCEACKKDLWARIEIRSARFSAAVPVEEPKDWYAWGFLAPSEPERG